MNEDNMDMRSDVEELLQHVKGKILETDAESEVDSKKKSTFSQYVDAYDKFYKLYLSDTDQGFDQYIKDAEEERKKCEYLETISQKTKELELKNEELKLRQKEFESMAKNRNRETDIREASAAENGKWWNKPIVATAMTCGTILTVNGIALYLNATETPLKNIFERWMLKVNPKL